MRDDSLTLQTMRIDRTVCTIASGNLDLQNADELSALASLLEDAPQQFLLDLTGLAYMDSSGLQTVLTLHRAAKDRGTPMTVYVRSQSNVHRVMRIVGADTVLSIVVEPEALESGPNPPTSRR